MWTRAWLAPSLGLATCIGLALLALWIASAVGSAIETALTIAFGLAAGALPHLRAVTLPGATLAARVALRAGVALLGARLTLDRVLDGGAEALVGAALVVTGGLTAGIWLARRLQIPGRLAGLIAVGMAICGNSAILALSPILRAKGADTTYAVSTITLFGLIGVLTFPLIGTLIGLSDHSFGIWAGLAINDTAQVVAAGYAVSGPAGDTATIVKLTRNLAIAPVLIGAALIIPGTAAARPGMAVVRAIPWFVVGFVLLAGLRSLGMLDAALPTGGTLADALSASASVLILIALAGVGLSADLRSTLHLGHRPFLLGASLWVLISILGLTLAIWIGAS